MNKTISDAELEVMRVLWKNKKAMTLAELRTEVMQVRDWNKSTVQTLVIRLRDKGIIEPLDKYGPAQYIPLVTEDEYLRSEGKAMLEKFGSAKKLALALVHSGQLTDSDIEELREFFKMGGDGK